MMKWLARLVLLCPLSRRERVRVLSVVRAEDPDEQRFPLRSIRRLSRSEVRVIVGEGEGPVGEWYILKMRRQADRWVIVESEFIVA
jgi:hypothetical protein